MMLEFLSSMVFCVIVAFYAKKKLYNYSTFVLNCSKTNRSKTCNWYYYYLLLSRSNKNMNNAFNNEIF